MKKLTYSFLMFGLLCFSSCEYMLDVDTVSGITNNDYWKSEGDAESYLFGIYSRYRDVMNSTFYLEDRGDTFEPGMVAGLTSPWLQNLTPQNAPNWLNFYSVVHHCNTLIKNIEGINFSNQEDKNRILAETYFIRAHMYFYLLRIWGDVPLELQPTESDTKEMLPRAPAAQVMDHILNDVNTAIELFPDGGYLSKNRASQPACYALKADVLLWNVKVLGADAQLLEKVVSAADAASAGLTLEDDFSRIFSTEAKNGSEIIFAVYFERDEKDGHYSRTLKPNELHVQDAVNRDAIPYSTDGRHGYAPSEKLLRVFNEFPTDQRRDKSVIAGITAEGDTIAVFDNKFRGTPASGNRFFDNDIIIYRLAEMFLFKAEALNALNRGDEAVDELNKVRQRAHIGEYEGPTDQQTLDLEILKERFRELYLELKRWPDLVRFHYGGTIDAYNEVPNLEGKTIPLFFPIPQVDIDRNPKLNQTDGYIQ